jgi:6-phosphogluconolactonase (cycloisomerase 2 family)
MKFPQTHRTLAMTFFAVLVLILAGCSGQGTHHTPTLTSIAVTPATPSVAVGFTQQFTATGTYSDSSTQNLTASVTWSSGTVATATITSPGGLATAVTGGTSVITATSGTVSGNTTMTVATLSSIAVTPANPSIGVGATEQFTATGTYSDASTHDITASVTWSSGTIAKATITSPGGLATAVATGTSIITATSGAVSGNTLLTVIAPTLVSIKITPANPTIAVGGTADFTGVGLYSDGSTQPLSPITWSSGTAATASIISTSGVSLGLATGTSTITATNGTVSGTTLLTVGAAATRFAYAANGGDGTISIYAVNGSTFTPRGYVFNTHSSIQVIPEPSGHYLFSLNGDNTISTYGVNSASGALTDLSATVTPVSNAGILPYQGSMDPTGQFLYVANNQDNKITAFSVNTATGALTQIGSPTVPGNGPSMVLTDRHGKFLYVVNSLDDTISCFPINTTTGALGAQVAGSPFGTGSSPFLAAIDPADNYLYVGDTGDDTIAGFTINQTTGVLTQIGASNFGVTAGDGPYALAIDPTSKYLYVVNFNTESLSGYSIGAGGALGALASFPTEISSSPTGAIIGTVNSPGSSPFSVSIDPAGTFLAIPNQGTNSVALFSLNTATGAATSAGNLSTRSGPEYVNLYVGTVSPILAPAAVFATNGTNTTGTISAYTVAPTTGVLTATAAPTTGANGNAAATTDITGAYFFASAASTTTKDILGFGVTQTAAALSPLTGSPVSVTPSTLGTVISEPSDRFVYMVGTGAPGSVLGFTLDPTVPSLTPIAGLLAVTNIKAIADDSQGSNIYTLGTNLIEQATINGDGTLNVVAGQTITTAGTWQSAVVDASGQYLLALDSAGKDITVFFVGPTSYASGFPPVPVAYGAVMSTKAVTGTTLSSLVISPSPTSRFVYVIDSGANTITGFTFDPITATLTAIAGTTTLAGQPGQATIDATGKYLFVAVEGNPATNPGSVAVYSIGTTGTLTAVTSSPFAAGVGTQGVAVSNSIQ